QQTVPSGCAKCFHPPQVRYSRRKDCAPELLLFHHQADAPTARADESIPVRGCAEVGKKRKEIPQLTDTLPIRNRGGTRVGSIPSCARHRQGLPRLRTLLLAIRPAQARSRPRVRSAPIPQHMFVSCSRSSQPEEIFNYPITKLRDYKMSHSRGARVGQSVTSTLPSASIRRTGRYNPSSSRGHQFPAVRFSPILVTQSCH